MINQKLTEDFIDMHYFVLDVPYSVEEYDEDGRSTDKWIDLEPGSEWEITDDSYIGGDIHLNNFGNTWIEIPEDTFRRLFSAHEWVYGSL